MEYNFNVYYKDYDKYHFYNNTTKQIYIKAKLPTKISNFELTKGYETKQEDLIRYSNDLLKCNEELKTYLKSKNKDYDYLKYEANGKDKIIGHSSNVLSFFYYFSKKETREKFEESSIIDKIEESYFRKCNNSGIIYEEFETKTPVKCYERDMKHFYPSLLGEKSYKLEIPINKGREIKISKLDKNKIQYGIYNVKISCPNSDIKKVFSFSKEHYYTHYSLIHAFELKEKYFNDLEIELITDGEYNAYVYDELIKSSDIFEGWLKNIVELKNLYPKNFICKKLASSLWGTLCQYKKIEYNLKTIEKKDLDTGRDFEECNYLIDDIRHDYKTEKNYYTLINTHDSYIHKYARLKSFLTSLGRHQISKRICYYGIQNVYRVYIDGVVFNQEFETKPNAKFVPSNKHTGEFKFPIKRKKLSENTN